MAFQLVYTSYPVSLSVGRSGFSTVARSSDMPEKLVVKVEKCGIYDSRAPIIYSHRIVEANGGKWHVLSRVCDSGTDYTNRNNYIAHHLVISSEEAMKLGVVSADILRDWREPPVCPRRNGLQFLETPVARLFWKILRLGLGLSLPTPKGSLNYLEKVSACFLTLGIRGRPLIRLSFVPETARKISCGARYLLFRTRAYVRIWFPENAFFRMGVRPIMPALEFSPIPSA